MSKIEALLAAIVCVAENESNSKEIVLELAVILAREVEEEAWQKSRNENGSAKGCSF